MDETNQKPPAKPVQPAQRALSIDAIRGFAILGILPVNIQYFGMGLDKIATNPTDTDHWVRAIVHVLFESKFISIFSLLFGAGIVLMDRSAQRRGTSGTGVYLRRTAILLTIGLIHAYLFWYGDILVTYAIIGFAAYWFRRLEWKWLLLIGGALFFFGWLFTSWIFAQGGDSSGLISRADELAAARGGFFERVMAHIWFVIILQTVFLVLFAAWFNAGLMLIGMALVKAGFFTGELATRLYLGLIVFGAVIAIPAITIATSTIPEGAQMSMAYSYVNLVLAPVLGLGYASVIILICTRHKHARLLTPLAATGRMALTNYLFQSVACVFLFYGGLGGLGLIGRYNDTGVFLIGAGIIVAQLVLSTLWLRAFRFGPAEWLWRSLTYGRVQPMLRSSRTPR